jgi:hypothetical protein
MTTSTIRRTLTALAVALVAVAGATTASAAPTVRPPLLTISGSGIWAPHPHGDVVVNGQADVTWRSGVTRTVDLAAVIGPDDRTLPAPGECEPAVSTITINGRGLLDVALIGDGDVCGHHLQPPTSIVTHVFTGRYEVLDTTRQRLAGTDGFFEIRIAADGTANAFAIDT